MSQCSPDTFYGEYGGDKYIRLGLRMFHVLPLHVRPFMGLGIPEQRASFLAIIGHESILYAQLSSLLDTILLVVWDGPWLPNWLPKLVGEENEYQRVSSSCSEPPISSLISITTSMSWDPTQSYLLTC